MKLFAMGLMAGLVVALPYPQEDKPKPLGSNMMSTIAALKDKNGLLDGGLGPKIRDEVIGSNACGKVILIFARASQEPANMGGSMGPLICNGLKKEYGDAEVLCQGVGNGYTAGIADNITPKGTSAAAIKEATKMFTTADTKCPNAVIVFGGFSQGTAVMHNTVGALPAALKSKIAAGVLFGDTRNAQDKSQVPNYPKDNVEVYCAKDDGVCWGSLNVTNGHFAYALNGDGDKALAFLKSKIAGKMKSG